MANVDLPRGFRPYGELKHVGIYIAAQTIYPGDAVKLNTGTSSTTRFRTQVDPATAGAAMSGVALNYAAAGEKVRVADDPQQLFAGQADASALDNNNDLPLNASIVVGSPNTTYKVSGMQIDDSTLATTATLECKILGYVERQDGKNQMGANAEVIFKINNHQLASGTGTAGV